MIPTRHEPPITAQDVLLGLAYGAVMVLFFGVLWVFAWMIGGV